jgi:uncharacterized protein with von Willebrand factor type A (vWA) domain
VPIELGEVLLQGVVAFAHHLRNAGMNCGPDRVALAARVIRDADMRRRSALRTALRAIFAATPEQWHDFDSLFELFWSESQPPSAQAARQQKFDRGQPDRSRPRGRVVVGTLEDEPFESSGADARSSASDLEVLATMDLAALDPALLVKAGGFLAELGAKAPRRLSARLVPNRRGHVIDRVATTGLALRFGGEFANLRFQTHRMVRRRVVFLIDVSGSMEPYAQRLLLLIHPAVAAASNVEVFTFGTKLTRVTDPLRSRRPMDAMHRASRVVPDWAGGTRIGESLREFNRRWGRPFLARGAVVVIASDGLECSNTSLLSAELASLSRLTHTLVWMNPLTADPDFQPISGGMRAALPHVDVFLPGHSLECMRMLVDVVAALRHRHRSRLGLAVSLRAGVAENLGSATEETS